MPEQGQRLTPGEIAALFDGVTAYLVAELGHLPERALRFHPTRAEWCVKEVVGHLIEAEMRGFAGRIRQMLAEDSPALEPWDQVAVARARGDCERDARELLGEFLALRRASAELVRSLRDADLARGGQHPKVGWLTVDDVLHEWVHHDRNHLQQIMGNVQAFVWPALGNAQRFSLP
jgi:hypothetical protein